MSEGDEPGGEATQRWVRMRRRLAATPRSVYRAWSDPEELARWFPEQIEGSLAVGTRTTLVWPQQRVWWQVQEATPDRVFSFRWPWLENERLVTTVRVTIVPVGFGSRVELEDGPFPIHEPGVLDAWSEAIEGWAEALAQLRAHLDFSIDLRPRGL